MADKFRNWTFCVYPESAPKDWVNILNKEHLCFGVSPLHDSDLNGDDTEKKPHWHVFLKFDGVQTYDQIYEIVKTINGAPPKRVSNPIGLVRYFVHIDNPEKHQYLIEDIQAFGGFHSLVEEAFKIGIANVNKIMIDMQDWIVEHQITEYEDLWTFSQDLPQWRYVLNMYNCNSVIRLLTSIRNRK